MKVVVFNRVSLDGFFAGPHGEIDWAIADPELDQAVHGSAGKPGTVPPATLLMGRVTYQLLESVWPKIAADPNAPQGARATANELNQMTKVVFSTTLPDVTWVNSRLVRGNVAQEVRRLKQAQGPDMLIFGSGTIIQQLAAEGLIDEYLLALTPVALGAGKSMFTGVPQRDLELVEARSFQTGNVLLHYRMKH